MTTLAKILNFIFGDNGWLNLPFDLWVEEK
jgi:hypothetical protein